MLAKALFRQTVARSRVAVTNVAAGQLVARQLIFCAARGFAANTASIEKSI